MTEFTVWSDRKAGQIANFWNHLHFHPTDAVEDAWGREILDRVAADHTAIYVRLYTMLEDLVSRDDRGMLVYRWDELDRRLDYMTAKNFRLLLCFNFMPQCLAADPDSLSWLRYKNKRFNSSVPREYREWGYVCEALTRHLQERYGQTAVESWFFQCWNEPDQIYWLGGDAAVKQSKDIDADRAAEYCKLYDHFADAVHRVNPRIQTGGPSVALSDRFLKTFLLHCTSGTNHATGAAGSRIDFVSVHAYSEYRYQGQLNQHEISPDNILTRLRRMHAIMQETGCGQLPMLMDEWGGATRGFCGVKEEPIMLFRETEYFSAFLARLIDRLSGAPELNLRLMLLCLSGQDYQKQEFDGCRTIFSLNGYPKPIYNAFRLASLLGETRLKYDCSAPDESCGIIPTATDSGHIALLLYHFTDEVQAEPQDVSCRLTVRELHGAYRLRRYLVDRSHANAYSRWTALRCPATPSIQERGQLLQAGALEPIFGDEVQTLDGEWSEDVFLTHNSVCLLEWTPIP